MRLLTKPQMLRIAALLAHAEDMARALNGIGYCYESIPHDKFVQESQEMRELLEQEDNNADTQ